MSATPHPAGHNAATPADEHPRLLKVLVLSAGAVLVAAVITAVSQSVEPGRSHAASTSRARDTPPPADGGLDAVGRLLVAPPPAFAALPDTTVQCGRLTPDQIYPPTPTNATLRPLLASWGFAGGFCRRWDNGTTRLSIYAYEFGTATGATQYLGLREEGVVRAHRQPGTDPGVPGGFTDSVPSTRTPGIADDYVVFPAGARVWVVVASGHDAAEALKVGSDVATRQAKASGVQA